MEASYHSTSLQGREDMLIVLPRTGAWPENQKTTGERVLPITILWSDGHMLMHTISHAAWEGDDFPASAPHADLMWMVLFHVYSPHFHNFSQPINVPPLQFIMSPQVLG